MWFTKEKPLLSQRNLLICYTLLGNFFCLLVRSNGNIDWNTSKPKICADNERYSLVHGNNATKIYYKVIVTDLFDVSEERMEFGLQTLVFEMWQDKNWPELDIDSLPMNAESIPRNIQSCLWQPDLIFPNCKQSHLYDVTVPNVFLKILPLGYILRYARYHMLVSCPMSFKHYPMDTQICGLNITLFSHFEDQVDLQWVPKDHDDFIVRMLYPPIEIIVGVKPLQFSLEKFRSTRNRIRLAEEIYTAILVCEFTLVRHLTASLVNTYIPSLLVVCLSMVSFWLDVNAVPGRVTLGVTALLTLTTMIVHARSSLPSVNYMTAIDIWLFGCLVMVFLSLIEFTMAQTIYRRAAQKRAQETLNKTNLTAWSSKEDIATEGLPQKISGKTLPKSRTAAKKTDNILDRISRYLFPSSLITFTTLYVIYYSAVG